MSDERAAAPEASKEPETPVMTSNSARAWRNFVPVLLVIVPILGYVVIAAYSGPAHAQGKGSVAKDEPAPTTPRVADERPRAALPAGTIELTTDQERALDVKTVIAKRRIGDHKLVTGGKVSLDLERTARVRPLLSSIIFDVRKRAGDTVKKGDELLVVESTDLGDAKNNYLTALANLEVAAETYRREALLRVAQGTTDTEFHNARASFRTASIAVEAAREKCLLLGVRDQELDALAHELPLTDGGAANDDIRIQPPDPRSIESDAHTALREIAARHAHRTEGDDTRRRARYTIRAPIDGVLIAKDAARGEFVDPSQVIATVSDISQLWINVDVYQSDIPKVQIGARVDVTTPVYPDLAFVGSVTFLSETVDDVTHALKARVVVNNAKRLLKSGMAAKTIVHCPDVVAPGEKPPIELPPSAVIHEGQDAYAIVKVAPGRYQRRKVTLGLEAEDAAHVDSGIEEDDEVVLEGNLFIHTEIPLGD